MTTPNPIDKILSSQKQAVAAGRLTPEYAKLAKHCAPNRTAGIATNVMWAINNFANEFNEIDVNRIPSRAAVVFLKDAHGMGLTQFMQTFSKFLTDRGSAEAAAEAAFKQRQMNGMLDDFILDIERKFGEQNNESHGDDAVPQVSDATGSERPS